MVARLPPERAAAATPSTVVDVIGEQAFGSPRQRCDRGCQLVGHRSARRRPRVSPDGRCARDRRREIARRSHRHSRNWRRGARSRMSMIFLLASSEGDYARIRRA
jgi:hypothetical protein